MLTMITRILKTLAAILIFSALLSLTATAQQFNQNVQYTKLASYTGRPEVKDTSFWIVNGTDTLRITIYGDTVRFISTAAAYKFTPALTVTTSKEVAFGSSGWVQYNLNDSLYADTLFTRSSSTNNTWIAKLAQADTAAQLFVGNYLGALNAAGYGYGSYNSATGLGAFSAAFKAGSTINNTMYSGGKGQTNTNVVITTVNVTNNQGTTTAYSSYLSDSTRAVLYLSAQETDSATFPAALSYKRSGAQRGFYVDNQTPGWFIRGGTKFRLPVTDGSAGYALTTNGSGTLSFGAIASGDSLFWGTGNGALYPKNLSLNVGIGTATPNYGFDVQNRTFNVLNNNAGGAGYSQIISTEAYINVYAGSSVGNHTASLGVDSFGFASLSGTDSIYLYSTKVIVPSANVGIGTIDPTAKLHVTGNFRLVDGTEGTGKTLVSDSIGNATWSATAFTPADSVTIYALIPDNGTTYYCTDCSGNGITGRIVSFFGAAWRRQLFE